MKKDKVVILGSTGSIGTQSIDVLKTVGDKEIIGLSCKGDIEKLYKQILETGAKYVSIFDCEKAKDFKLNVKIGIERLNDKLVRSKKVLDKKEINEIKNKISILKSVVVYDGMKGLIKLATLSKANIVIISVVGMIGIRPTIEAIKKKKTICLANKESLVCAGDIIMPLAKKKKVEIRPIDSEHSAIWQCLQGEKKESVNKIIITASGGPFYGKKKSELKKVKVEDALKHPNWSMGKKITIDSATLVNKGLEVMEAHHLFSMPYDKIEVVVQRESLIHSMVEFIDGSIKAQLGVPSMRVPIEYAIYKDNRKFINEKTIDFTKLDKISIGKPDLETFKGLKLAYIAIKNGGLMPSVYNALNEVAVRKFLNKEIKYLDIANLIEKGMKAFYDAGKNKKKFTIKDIEKTMEFAEEYLTKDKIML